MTISEVACSVNCVHILELVQTVREGVVRLLELLISLQVEKWFHVNLLYRLVLRFSSKGTIQRFYFQFC